ncbi:Pre-mRNA-splicing factor prp46 [Microdochium trichocladiopsis]|uniref:Pre-mRNA-splicing factor PRP46 n=1 Tax=Microdochium trichocladiopsis TaxID=1682393 RepID=A0A9P9BTU1_9PEZI|nr:Pre-mRNA-splicing factor prp46 [Microdochium trichocladiopsis]KAH7030799.1 Pre-mRNA-splicing factor prp46 [Microdochium trichocladiopsis]
MEVASTDLGALALQNAKRSKALFGSQPAESTRKRLRILDPAEAQLEKEAIALRLHAEYSDLRELPTPLAQKQANAAGAKGKGPRKSAVTAGGSGAAPEDRKTQKLIEGIPSRSAPNGSIPSPSNALVRSTRQPPPSTPGISGSSGTSQALSTARAQAAHHVKPDWHPPWKLMRVISGHLGWVRALAVEPENQWFASGAGDRTIKIWDLATGNLRLTLTGHISTVRGLAISPRHPYLFSCGEDKMVKCWDLETNKVIRHYHGHLSGVYTLSLHPTLDVLVTGGRDGVARVWDMRTRSNIHVLSGHTQTVADVKCQEADPQVITASLDSTVRLWDLAAGKTMSVLTHHKKGVRALALHPTEFTFATGSTGSIKQWKCPEGAFMGNFEGHNAIINSLAANEDVLFSGGDNGSMSFWDWKTGHRFQALDSIAQPGSLDAEAGIMSSTFDRTGLRLIVGEADKTIKIWKPDEKATPETHPLEWKPTLGRRKY